MIPSNYTPSYLGFRLGSGSLPSPSDRPSSLLSPRLPPPALAPPSISSSTAYARIGTQMASSSLHLPDSLGVAQFLSSSRRPSSAQAQPEPSAAQEAAKFFEGTKVDPVYQVPDRAKARGNLAIGKPPLHPNRPNVNRGKAVCGDSQVDLNENRPVRANVPGGEERDQASQGDYDSLVSRLMVLTETQRDLGEAVNDMEATNIDLSGRVHDVEMKTTETIIRQQQAMSETSNHLHGRIEKVEKKGDRVELKRAIMEVNITGLIYDNGRLEFMLGGKNEKLKKIKEEIEKSSRILKYGFIGGLVVAAAYVLFK